MEKAEQSGSASADAAFVANPIVANRYRIERRIAKGGMATVFLATDLTLNRQVAIKILQAPKVTDDPGKLLERFKLEAESLAKMNHRNIVAVFDYGPTEDGGYFLAMEFIDGKSMAQMLRNEEFPPERAIRLMLQVARALRYAHKKGLVHRDLKPGNVLVLKEEDEEVAKLVDFGLAKADDDEPLTQHGLILGSVHCMSPEQIRGSKVDPRTDIYAFGVVMFRLIVGQYPYNSSNTAETLSAHIHAPLPRFASLAAHLMVPSGLEDVVHKCMQKNPEDRYADTDQLIEDLASCLSIPPEDFVSVSIMQPSGLSTQPQPTGNTGSAAGGVGVALTVLVGLALLSVTVAGIAVALAAFGVFSSDALPTEPDIAVITPPPVELPPPNPPVEPPINPPVEPNGTQGNPEVAVVNPPVEVPPVLPADPPKPDPGKAKVIPPKPPKPVDPPKADPPKVVVENPPPDEKPPTFTPTPTYGITVDKIVPEVSGGSVKVRITLSNASVKPLSGLIEGASTTYPTQCAFDLKGGGSNVGSRIPTGHPVAEAVTLSSKNGKLMVRVNSKSTALDCNVSGSGTNWVITATPK